MPITAIPRTVIKAGLQGLRIPLTAVERVSGNTDTVAWPPAVAFETFESGAKQVLGALIRDESLVHEGQLQRAKLGELVESERLHLKAEQKRLEADARLEDRLETAEQTRERVERQAQEREQELAREKAEKERRVFEQAQQRQRVAEEADVARQKAVVAQERSAKKTRIAEESAALEARSDALGAARAAEVVDHALEAKKAKRKSS